MSYQLVSVINHVLKPTETPVFTKAPSATIKCVSRQQSPYLLQPKNSSYTCAPYTDKASTSAPKTNPTTHHYHSSHQSSSSFCFHALYSSSSHCDSHSPPYAYSVSSSPSSGASPYHLVYYPFQIHHRHLLSYVLYSIVNSFRNRCLNRRKRRRWGSRLRSGCRSSICRGGL